MATALNNRANIFRRQSRFAEAKHDYQAALAAGGKAQYVWYGLGQIAEAEGDALGARGFYAKAVTADPAYALASQRLAALGGAPEGAINNPQSPILLKPPAQTASAKPPQDAAIVLHPPHPRTPAPKPAPSASPASDSRTAGKPITLRPALDQSAAARGEVQLGAWRSEAEARTGWDKAVARAGDLLAGRQPHVVMADLPGRGRYYRLRVAPAAGASRSQFCDSLSAAGVTCFPVRD